VTPSENGARKIRRERKIEEPNSDIRKVPRNELKNAILIKRSRMAKFSECPQEKRTKG